MRRITNRIGFLGGTLAMITGLSLNEGQAKPGLTLVEDSRPTAVIVMPDRGSPVALAAATLLEDVLFRMSGAHLPKVAERELGDVRVEEGLLVVPAMTNVSAFILVGEGSLTRQLGATRDGLGPGGIRIKTGPNTLVLLGTDTNTPSDIWGTYYAVTTFLDDTLGCKFLWPGDSGFVIPSNATLHVPSLDIARTPALRQRNIRSIAYHDRIQLGLDRLALNKDDYTRQMKVSTPDWFRWHRLGGTLGLVGGDGTILSREAWDRFAKEHPEWFAMQADGSRDIPAGEDRPRLCKSNAQLIEAIAAEKIRELKANPQQFSISLMTPDGGQMGMCLCPACKALDPPNGKVTKIWTHNHAKKQIEWFDYVSLTDRMFTFYNAIAEKVAREYPNVLFCGQAYSVYSAPPLKTKLHPNIIIRYVGINYMTDTLRAEGLRDWDTWSEAASKLYFRPNLLLSGRREGTPMIYVHKLAKDFRHLLRTGMLGTDFDAVAHNWATQGLNYYIAAKLQWNPELDVDAALDDYCRAGFGPGWKNIRNYFKLLEKLSDRVAKKELFILDPYTPEAVADLRVYLDKADTAAAGDAAARRRILFLRRGLDFTDLQAQIYRLFALAKDRALTDAEKAEAAPLMERRFAMMKQLFQDEPYAVNVAYVLWNEGRKLAPLGWDEPAPQVKAEVVADELGQPVERKP